MFIDTTNNINVFKIGNIYSSFPVAINNSYKLVNCIISNIVGDVLVFQHLNGKPSRSVTSKDMLIAICRRQHTLVKGTDVSDKALLVYAKNIPELIGYAVLRVKKSISVFKEYDECLVTRIDEKLSKLNLKTVDGRAAEFHFSVIAYLVYTDYLIEVNPSDIK